MIRIVLVITLLVALIALLWACETCRHQSVQDAEYWQGHGYKVRIVVYRTGIDGELAGLGRWKYHAQAQVFKDSRWWWVDDGLNEGPTYTIGDKEQCWPWRLEDYRAFLVKAGKYY